MLLTKLILLIVPFLKPTFSLSNDALLNLSAVNAPNITNSITNGTTTTESSNPTATAAYIPSIPTDYSSQLRTTEDSEDTSDSKDPSTLSPIVVQGNKFFDSKSGAQFFLKGIAYQPSRSGGDGEFANLDGAKFIDPLAVPSICLRDLPYLVDLGVNTVRVYSIDADRDHDVCFKAFEEAGIYVIADLSEPDVSVVREAPTWDITILERYQKVVDSLQKYDNLLGFFAGNEVTNDKTNTDASPFVKSSIRDIKKYIKAQNYRQIPVGYATNDDAETRSSVADYFTCGDVSADFYGINMYEWCGYSTYWTSGYKERTEEFKDYPVPVFFSEFGCNLKRPRPFTEIEALYGRLMSATWSGGIAYMYFEEPNQYGVVEVIDGNIVKLQDYHNLKSEFGKVSPTGTTLEQYNSKTRIAKLPQCPYNTNTWKASNFIPHSPDSIKCDCMESSLECKLSPSIKKSEELKKVFQYACSVGDCSTINGDGKDGKYGEFSDCSSRQKASYIVNEVFKLQGGRKQDCNFNGLAILNPRVASTEELETIITGTGDSCASMLRTHNFKKAIPSKNLSSSNTTSSNKHQHDLRNDATSQRSFYQNIVNGICGAFFFTVVLTVLN